MLKKLKLLSFAAATFCTIFLSVYNIDVISSRFERYRGFSNRFQRRSHVLFTEGCKVPHFDPFDPTVVMYYEKMTGDIPCEGKKYVGIENNVVVLNEEQVQRDFKDEPFNCTYRPIYRNPKNETSRADNKFDYGNEAVLKFADILPAEFVKISCGTGSNWTYEDYLASTPIKPLVEQRCNKFSGRISTPNPLNVIVLGIDSVSKLNFERHFLLTADYLRRNLSAFEFHGYMKVADNTFPNLTPLLTGHFVDHYYNQSNRRRYFDALHFIWKNFSSIGYRTLYAEDAPVMGTYNYAKNGFQYPPTDYFFRPFTLAIEDTPYFDASRRDCFQANPEIVVLFDYLRSFLSTMGERPYLAFTWAARLTHGKLNKAGYADKPTYELLRDIHDRGLLNKSVLIFMSDHGIRFGGIRQTFIGKIEERMPFLFASFPTWFLESHPEIRTSLNLNQGRLTTPFDVHETLVDVFQMTSGDKSHARTPYGISLFREIPANRNCQSAFIKPHWCVCHDYEEIGFANEMARSAARSIVDAVNNMTERYRRVCERVSLRDILDARVSKPQADLLRYRELGTLDDETSVQFGNDTGSFQKLMMTVRTQPGGALFESTLRKIGDGFKVYDISRINAYGNQSACVDDSNVRKYCYCK